MIHRRSKLSVLVSLASQTPALQPRSSAKVDNLSLVVKEYVKHEFFDSLFIESCQVNNGGCGVNAVCSYNPKTNAPICTCKAGYVNTGTNTSVVCTLTSGRCVSNLTPAHVNTSSQTFTKGNCPSSPDGYRYGWHFITPDISSLFFTIKCDFKKAGTITKMIQTPSTQHCFVHTPTDDTLISASAVVDGVAKSFSLAHVCGPAF